MRTIKAIDIEIRKVREYVVNKGIIFFFMNLHRVLHKALPPGTKRQRKDGVYQKQSNGKWMKIREKGTDDKKDEKKVSSTEELNEKIKEEMKGEHVKDAKLEQEAQNFKNELEKKHGASWKASPEEQKILEQKTEAYHVARKETSNKERELKKKIYIEDLGYTNTDIWEEKADTDNGIWYHGTHDVFDEFDPDKRGKQFGNIASKLGIHMTDTKSEADQYGSLTKKIKVDKGENFELTEEKVWEEFKDHMREELDESEFESELENYNTLDAIDFMTKKVKDEGWDSFTITESEVWDEVEGSTTNTVIFDPNRVKIIETGIDYSGVVY